jgi:hypothetical protein
MFKKAIKEAMKKQGRSGRWLAMKTGIPLTSLWQGLGENGYQMSMGRVEKCFVALKIEIVVSDD